MKLNGLPLLSAIVFFLGLIGMNPQLLAAVDEAQLGVTASSHMPIPKLEQTIDLSDLGLTTSAVKKMTFSPDGRFLAVVDNPTHMKTDIVVWDLKLDKKQAHIHCPYNYGDLTDHDLLWSRDGKIISFGAKRQWDPMTGEAIPDNPAIGRGARLNKDGSKMLTIVGALGEPSYIHIYDTQTWALQKLYVDGLAVQSAAWTSDDKILVAASITKESFGKAIDGHAIATGFDTALRILDPNGKEPTKAVWFPASPTGDPKWPFVSGFPIGAKTASNFPRNEIFLDAGRVVSASTLNVRNYHAVNEGNSAPGAFGMGFSPDGRFIFLKGASFKFGGDTPIKNSIVDIDTGKVIAEFGGAMDHQGGLAVSPDGIHLALGDIHSVLIFTLQ